MLFTGSKYDRAEFSILFQDCKQTKLCLSNCVMVLARPTGLLARRLGSVLMSSRHLHSKTALQFIYMYIFLK